MRHPGKTNPSLTSRARRLRKEMTSEERKLWYLFLRDFPDKIYRQRVIGPYIADFYCPSASLVIEVDGAQHFEEQGLAYDADRAAFMHGLGISTIRVINREVNENFAEVCQMLEEELRKRKKT